MEELTLFFYLLGRDHLPVGTIEQIIQQVEKSNLTKGVDYTEPLFADLAHRWAKRATGDKS